MTTYNFIDKNSSIVITINANSENEARAEIMAQITMGLKYFRCEKVED